MFLLPNLVHGLTQADSLELELLIKPREGGEFLVKRKFAKVMVDMYLMMLH